MNILVKILFSLNTGFLGAILYTFIKGRTEQHNSGWDGIASALGNFALGFLIFAVLGYLISRKLSPKSIKHITIGLSLISMGLIGFTYYRVNSETNKAIEEELTRQKNMPKTTKAINKPSLPSEGISKVKMGGNNPIYLLSPNSTEGNISFKTVDSIVFDLNRTSISYAPPYFVPYYSKIDYNMLFLQVTSRMDKAVEVIVNETDGRRAYIYNTDVDFMDWPSFILSMNSVEIIRPQDNLLRNQPLSHTPPLENATYAHLQPYKVQGDWLQVNLLDDDLGVIRKAWVMWNFDGQLALRFNPLS
jgi:hypothetical protein